MCARPWYVAFPIMSCRSNKCAQWGIIYKKGSNSLTFWEFSGMIKVNLAKMAEAGIRVNQLAGLWVKAHNCMTIQGKFLHSSSAVVGGLNEWCNWLDRVCCSRHLMLQYCACFSSMTLVSSSACNTWLLDRVVSLQPHANSIINNDLNMGYDFVIRVQIPEEQQHHDLFVYMHR